MQTFIGSGDAARILGCSRQTVQRLASSGELPPVGKLDGPLGGYVFDPETVRDIAASRSRS